MKEIIFDQKVKSDEALEMLRGTAQALIVYHNDDLSAEEIADSIKDVLEDIELVVDKGWKFVIFRECEMAPNGYTVNEYEGAK